MLYILLVIKLYDKSFQANFQDYSWKSAVSPDEFWYVRDLDVLEMPFKQL